MLSPKLWGTSVKGNVYTLHTNASEWVQVRNQHNVLQGFKKVIASPTGAWALGCDHQVYIYVEKSDVPIRCQVSTFENERWLPTQGWSGRNLLPAVDPFDWSSEDGHVHLPRGDFKLPSRGWEWEEEWRLDLNVRGFATDQQGWRYSHIGFQSGFTHKKTFKSCVRRRRWIRYRRYMAIDRWSKLASIHLDPLEEPIVDVTIGGYSLPNLEEGAASVWIVTIDGKIVLRSGVSQKIPEGVSWVHITLAGDDEEVVSISAGATSLVWAVTYHGAIIARTGITWQNLKGNKWVQIPAPEGLGKKDRVVQVSVGNESAWVVSSEGKVWFRKGISKTNPHGIGWLQMVDTMKMVAVIGQDKVIGVNIEDRQLYFRMGISRDEQSGRLWQLVDLPFTRMTQIPSGSICSEVSSFSDEGINIDANSAMEKYEQSRSRHSSENSLPMLSVTGELSGEHAETDVMQGGNQNNSGKTLQNYVTCWEKDTINADTSESDASCTVPGRKSSQSDTDTFLSMGLTNDFCGLELNLDEDQETYNTEGRGSFGHLTIDMDQDQHPSEDVDTERLMDHPSIVWDKSLQIKDSNSSEQKPKFSFNRLRTHIGNKLKSPVEVINKLKTTKPKEMLKDLKNDLQEGKKEVLGAISQAQEVFKHGKQENDMDKIKVTFKKEGDMAECENMELKFYDDSVNYTTNAETGNLVDTGGGNSNMKKSIPSNVDLESVTSGHITPSASLSTLSGSVFGEGDSDGHMSLLRPPEQDIGDIQWCWVSGCFMQDVEETRLKHWFYTDKDSALKMIYQKQVSTSSWRDVILKNLRQMAERVNKYKYPQAIENTSWCKTGNMKWWQDVHRGHKWLQCKVELSQDEEKSCSSLTIHYTWKSKHQHLFIDLNDVVCIHCEKEDSPGTHSFCIYTTERQTASPPVSPIRLCTTEEETMEDWVSSLCLTLSGVHGTMGKPHAQSMWSLTNRNDVFVHEPSTESSTQTSTLLWRHFGGHLHKVESNCLGITWGIANNGTAYCYSGGYGGGFFKGVASSPYGINAMVDTHTVYVYENQRWTLGKGYTNKAKLVRHYMWSDETGRKELTRNSVRLASRHMTWISDWMVDYRTPGGVDKEGWQYATGKSFFKKFHPRPKLNSYLRRRRWCRKYRVATTGPWEEMGPLKLVDVSVQPDPFQTGLDQPVAVWAVGSGGEMLCREGVTLDSFRGVGWIHVPSDQVFTSVSVSMDLVVWAVSKDGGVWIRQGLSLKNIAGTEWLHISPPLHTHLTQVSAGASGVWMVDKAGSLWCRTGITPQNAVGTGWSKVRGDVRQVSAGLLDQVWTIMDQCDTSMGPVNGVLAKYTKSSPDDPTIGTWETGIGGGWKYICARGQMI